MVVAMKKSKNVITFGLGVPDPKGVFGTTIGLQEKFGKERVFDMPTSENAMTGVGIGASLNGLRPVMVHQRVDFFLLALDQLFNNAAKWRFMFGGKNSVPIYSSFGCWSWLGSRSNSFPKLTLDFLSH